MAASSSTWRPAACPTPTRWSAQVDPDNVLPEHPRPQLVRPVWCSLNGLWDCAVRPALEGCPPAFEAPVLVPFPIESSLSGWGRAVDATERVWYRRTIEVKAAAPGHVWVLHFGAVDWRAEVWLDGRPLGVHEGGFDPFSFVVGELGGRHELVVAAWDPSDDGPQPRGKQMRRPWPMHAPFFYTPSSGIWQSVWLEEVGATHVTRLRTTTRGDVLHCAASLHGTHGGERLIVVAYADGVEVARAEGEAAASVAMTIPASRRWSPADPFLYDLEVQLLHDDVVLDAARSYCGMREVTVQPAADGALRICLDGEPIFLHGLLDQGFWPDGLYTAPSDEALRFDLEETKRLGFNCVRKHVKVEPARWYWHCDRLGLVVLQDMPNGDRITFGVPIGGVGGIDASRWLGRRGIRRTAESKRIFRAELAAMIEQLASIPSIVAWVPFNEGWGQFDTVEIGEWVRELDPTRLVDVASGWVDHGTGDLRDVHVYHPGPRMPARRDPRRAEVLGEWGGLGLRVDGHRWPKRPFAYRTFPDADSLFDRYARGIAELERLIERGLTAAIYTQTTDVEGEVNGFVTYDRAVLKFDAGRVAQLHAQLFATAHRLRAHAGTFGLPVLLERGHAVSLTS